MKAALVLVLALVAAGGCQARTLRSEATDDLMPEVEGHMQEFLASSALWDRLSDQEYFALYHSPGFKSYSQLDVDIAENNLDASLDSKTAVPTTNRVMVDAIGEIKKNLAGKKQAALESIIMALFRGVKLSAPRLSAAGTVDLLDEDTMSEMIDLSTPPVLQLIEKRDASCGQTGDKYMAECVAMHDRMFLSCQVANSIAGLSFKKLSKLFESMMNKELCMDRDDCRFELSEEADRTSAQLLRPISFDQMNGGYLKSWEEYQKLLKYPLGTNKISPALRNKATDAYEYLDRDGSNREAFLTEWTRRSAALKESFPDMTDAEAEYRAACTPVDAEGKEGKVNWNVCREEKYLRLGVMTNEDMDRILAFRSEITDSILEVAAAETHRLAMRGALEYAVNNRQGNGVEMAEKAIITLFQPHISNMRLSLFLGILKNHNSHLSFFHDESEVYSYEAVEPFKSGINMPAPRVTFPNLGSMTPTSDIDIPAQGLYAEYIVRLVYQMFRMRYGVETSTALDFNIYGVGSDLVIKTTEKRLVSRDVGTPLWTLSDTTHMFRGQRELVQSYYEGGDIASLLGVRRVVENDSQWETFTTKIRDRLSYYLMMDTGEHPMRMGDATCPSNSNPCWCGGNAIVGEYSRRLEKLSRMRDHLHSELDSRMKSICPDSHEADCLNRAMNELYSEKLADILPQRVVFEQFVDRELMPLADPTNKDFDPVKAAKVVMRADRLMVILSDSFTEAGYFGNEAYVGAGGSILHVVGNMQGGMGIMMTADHALQSINENYGMLLHSFHNFEHNEVAGLQLGRSLFQTGKYLIRIVDAFRFIQRSAADQLRMSDNLRSYLEILEAFGNALNKVKKLKYDNHERVPDNGVVRMGESKEDVGKLRASVLVRKTAHCLDLLKGFLHDTTGKMDRMSDDDAVLEGKTPEEIGRQLFLSSIENVVVELNAVSRAAGIGTPILSKEIGDEYNIHVEAFLQKARKRFDSIFYGKAEVRGDRELAVASMRQKLMKEIHSRCANGRCPPEISVRDDDVRDNVPSPMRPRVDEEDEKPAKFLALKDGITFTDAPICLKDPEYVGRDTQYKPDGDSAFRAAARANDLGESVASACTH